MGNENSKNKELQNRNGRIPEKHINGSANGLSANLSSNGLEISANGEAAVQKNGESSSLKRATEPNDFVVVELDGKAADAPVISEILEIVIHKEEVRESEGDQTDVSLPATNLQTETAKQKQGSESLTEPESVTLDSDEGNQEDNNPEENPVMNFFKSLTTSKITKKETAAPVAIKDQSQKENQPAATTTVAQVSEPPAAPKGMSIPPPPPPEPPKMDIKAEPAAKPVKATPREEAKAVAKQPQSSKGKSATLSKFFRSKKVDSSKAGTLEAAAKPEPPPPVQEAQKTASTSSFFSLFKPKVLLDHMTTKVQAASTSGVRLLGRTTGVAADPKKASPAPAAAPETVKAKEEPKAAAKLSEAVVDNKPASVASQAAGDAAKAPKKLEKRNSIHQFFKILGQKRNSTDAGIQTETLAVAPVPEKVK
uniref:breast carcinoma-amplified sequence 1 isoform X7 n=1 Tax=Gasterosteus aculeatus aculeatus TaxID=481459 RepID=UPI001A99EB3C|nr:breast carcinoma-amplified sequence 1 isoform X7 [Gasterosteus aculeatus aculeatus]